MSKPRDENPKIEETPSEESQALPDPFKELPRDLYHYLLEFLSLKDMVKLSESSATLWKKNQAPLFLKALQEAHTDQRVDGLNYLADMIEFNPELRKHGLNYKALATVLVRANYLLNTMVQSDPFCTWKIADLCGLDKAADECLPADKKITILDRFSRGRLFYKALGGQLESLKAFIQKHHTPFDQKKVDPNFELAFAAAIGGHVPVLEYLRDELKYPLPQIFLPATENNPAENLLHFGIRSGNNPTVIFLLKAHVNPKFGLNPTRCASNSGQWAMYNKFVKKYDPTTDKDIAFEIIEDALRTGNLVLAQQLMIKHKLNPRRFKEVVVRGGSPRVFKYFLDNGYLSLSDTFENGATVQHLLTVQGHLNLLRFVLKHEKAAKPENIDKTAKGPAALQVRDEHGRSLLHYAASGGQWIVYCYLRTLLGEKTPLPVDNDDNTVAHAAAKAGAVWFLKHLFQTDEGRQLMNVTNKYKRTILHSAANCPEPNCLMMLIDEFGQDPSAVDIEDNTVAHLLAKNALENPDYWLAIFVLDKNYPDAQLLDIPNNNKITVRSLIEDFKDEISISPEILQSYSRKDQIDKQYKK